MCCVRCWFLFVSYCLEVFRGLKRCREQRISIHLCRRCLDRFDFVIIRKSHAQHLSSFQVLEAILNSAIVVYSTFIPFTISRSNTTKLNLEQKHEHYSATVPDISFREPLVFLIVSTTTTMTTNEGSKESMRNSVQHWLTVMSDRLAQIAITARPNELGRLWSAHENNRWREK